MRVQPLEALRTHQLAGDRDAFRAVDAGEDLHTQAHDYRRQPERQARDE
jgi:hypothetical protein